MAPRDRQARQCQRRLNPPHEHEINRQCQQHVDPLQHHAINEQARILHVSRHPVEDRAGTVHVEEAEAQPLQSVVHPVAQVGDDLPLGQPGGGHVVVVSQHRPQRRLRDNRHGHHRDRVHRSPRRRWTPAKWIHRCPLRRIERVADDVDDRPQQLEPRQAQQQQHDAQHQRPQAIPSELPRQAKQAPHQFAGCIPALVVFAGRRFGHNQSDNMPPDWRPIQRKPVDAAQARNTNRVDGRNGWAPKHGGATGGSLPKGWEFPYGVTPKAGLSNFTPLRTA
jgi:hypothetical protein